MWNRILVMCMMCSMAVAGWAQEECSGNLTVNVQGSASGQPVYLQTSDAGPDRNVCHDLTTFMAGLQPDPGEMVTWSVLSAPPGGTIQFANANLHNTAITASVYGTYVLEYRLAIESCANTDIVELTFIPQQIEATAGPDQDICSGLTATLSGNDPGSYPASWSVASMPVGGQVSFTDAFLPATAISVTEPGDYYLVWSLDEGQCLSQDTVVIRFCAPALLVSKEIVSGSGYRRSGDLITYAYTITNAGNVPLNGSFTVFDDKIPDIPAVQATLSEGGSTVIYASYMVTEADLTTRSVVNQAYAVCMFNQNTVTSNTATAVAWVDDTDLQLQAAVSQSVPAIGSVVTFTLTLQNNGPNDANGVDVVHELPSVFSNPSGISGGGSIDPASGFIGWPGLSIPSGSSLVLQFDAEVGAPNPDIEYNHQVYISNINQYETNIINNTDQVILSPTGSPSWSMLKNCVSTPCTYDTASQIVWYDISVINTGDAYLKNIQITDPGADQSPVFMSGDINSNGVLDITETWVYRAGHTVTLADMDAGIFVNTATANGQSFDNQPLTPLTASATATAVQESAMLVLKASYLDRGPDNIASVGDTATYTYTVTNTGNVTLTNVRVEEFMFTGNGPLPIPAFVQNSGSSPAGSIVPGETATFRAQYVIIQADINQGSVDNQGIAFADPPPPPSGISDKDREVTVISNRGFNGIVKLSTSANEFDPQNPNSEEPTGLFIPHAPVASGALSVVEFVKLPNSNFRVKYKIIAGNMGNLILEKLMLTYDIPTLLGTTYVGIISYPQMAALEGNPELPLIGPGFPFDFFDNNSGRIDPGEKICIIFELEIDPDAPGAPMNMEQQVMFGGIPTDGTGEVLISQNTGEFYTPDEVLDASDSGEDPGDDNEGEPGDTGGDNDPTPIEIPSIDIAKTITQVRPGSSGAPGNLDVTYRTIIRNTGSSKLTQLKLYDVIRNDLDPVWSGFSVMPWISYSTANINPVLNTQFNGDDQNNIFDGISGEFMCGQEIVVEYIVEIDPNRDTAYPELTSQSQTVGKAMSVLSIATMADDYSDSGISAQGSNPGFPGDSGMNNDPTPLIAPALSAVKYVQQFTESDDPNHFEVEMRIAIKNVGNMPVTDIRLRDTMQLSKYLGVHFAGMATGGMPYIVETDAALTPALNPAFDGTTSNAEMFLPGTGLLYPGESLTIAFKIAVSIQAINTTTTLWNQAVASARAAQDDGTPVSDPQGSAYVYSKLTDAGNLHESTNPQTTEDQETDRDRTFITTRGNAGNMVWRDLNGNGIQEAGEPGIQGVIVRLYDCSNQQVGITSTNSQGQYSFYNILTGNYKIKVDISGLPSDLAFTLQGQGNDSEIDSDVDQNGWTSCVFIVAGEDTPIDAGILQLSRIGNFVWEDMDGDGIQETGEPGIPNIFVEVFNESHELRGSGWTNSNGQFFIQQLYPGNYYLKFTPSVLYEKTITNSGNNDILDSDLTEPFGRFTTDIFSVAAGQQEWGVDAGFYRCIRIGDEVWYDINKNDINDNNENGINGLEVNLYKRVNSSWELWGTAVTGKRPGTPSDDGYFEFCAPPGEYYFEVVMPPYGLVRVRPNIGSNANIDSDLTNAFGQGTSSAFTVLSGGIKTNMDAGFYPQAIVGNMVWIDDNQNGLQESAEDIAPGITVEAVDAQSQEVVRTSETDEEGIYELGYIEKSSIFIRFNLTEAYQQYGPTIPAAGDDTNDSDVDGSNGPLTTRTLNMQPGDFNQHIDFGLAFGILPVEWLYISAEKQGRKHEIKWSTAREVNVSHYVVERKLPFEKEFKPLPGQVKAAGNAYSRKDYNYMDADTEFEGVYTYRVRQVDYDGKSDVSREVSLQQFYLEKFNMYPNPCKENVTLHLQLLEDSEISIDIYDDNMKHLIKLLNNESIEKGSWSRTLDTYTWTPGVYIVLIKANGEAFERKLVKVE